MSSEVTGSAGSDRSAIWVACIAALFGVVGTLCGSAVTYFGNRALQNQQISQQNAAQANATRTAARLAVFRYQRYENLVSEMLHEGRYFVQPLPPPLSNSDEALIVATLSTRGLDALALADQGTTFVPLVLKGEANGAVLKLGDQTALQEASTDLEGALAVLKPIATRRNS